MPDLAAVGLPIQSAILIFKKYTASFLHWNAEKIKMFQLLLKNTSFMAIKLSSAKNERPQKKGLQQKVSSMIWRSDLLTILPFLSFPTNFAFRHSSSPAFLGKNKLLSKQTEQHE